MSNSSVFSLEIQELRRPSSSYRIDVKCFTSVKDIKDQLQKELKCPPSRMQLYQTVGSKGLANQSTLHDVGITQSGGTLYLAVVYSTNPQFMLMPAKDVSVDEQCEEMMDEVRTGLRSAHLPAKTDMLDCTGGVYFMKGSANTPVAVFKPSDEEQGMPNNPKGYAGNGDYGLRPFFRPGDGCLREMASYILDFKHFCGVPPTVLVHCEHDSFHYPRNQTGQKTMFPKLGSLQRFVPSGDTFEDIGHSLVGVLELQKIALLDMRLLNCDRNASNMLAIRKSPVARSTRSGDAPRKYSRSSSIGTASEGGSYGEQGEIDLEDFLDAEPVPQVSRYSDLYSLVPIDHGYCLPSHLRIDELDWAWFHCPHVAVEVQPEIREYVNSIDIDALLAELSRQVAVPEDCLFLLRVAHAVVKEGINLGLTLREIAAIIARTDEDVPSPLENAIAAAEDNAQRAMEMRAGRRSTTSPSFLKSLYESGSTATEMTASLNITELLMSPAGTEYGRGRSEQNLGSPAPVIVKQKSVGSPRSGGAVSPPQRIGALKRVTPPSPTVSPSEDSDGYSINSTAATGRTKSAVSGAAVAKKTRSRSSELDTGDADLSDGSSFASPIVRKAAYSAAGAPTASTAVVRPFPLRTPPERSRRVVSSELNLEGLGHASSPPPVAAPPSASSNYSLSSSSRSPIPLRPESAAYGARTEKVNIAYLSSENIQKLQSSPAMSACKFTDFLYRDPQQRTQASLPQTSGEAGRCASPSGDLGDYFMKDLTLPPAAAAVSAVEALRVDLPPMPLFTSSAASSPHCSRSSSAFTLHQPSAGSKDKIAPSDSADKLSGIAALGGQATKQAASVGNLPRASTSNQSVGSLGSGGSGSSGNLRPRPGDPLFTLQSFDEDYLRQQRHRSSGSSSSVGNAGTPATAASAPAAPLSLLPPLSVPIAAAPASCEGTSGAPRPSASPSVAADARRPVPSVTGEAPHPMMSTSLFASDSDFTSHSTGTSYESSWASESPKMSPKVPYRGRKAFPALQESEEEASSGSVSSKKAPTSSDNRDRVQVPVRNDTRYAKSISAAQDDSDCAAGSQWDGPVHLTIPLKDSSNPDPGALDRECSSSVELCGTDTEAEIEADAEDPGPLPQRAQPAMVRSAVKEPRPGNGSAATRELVSPDPGVVPAAAAMAWMQPPKLSRVTSFAAFESPPLYDLPKAERQLTRLRQEKRKANATTAEYQQLRLTFCREMVTAMLTKASRGKLTL